MIVFKNGRMMEVPDTGLLGSEIINAVDVAAGRVVVAVGDGRTKIIDANKLYRPKELQTRSGKWVQFEDSPDRSKGGDFLLAA